MEAAMGLSKRFGLRLLLLTLVTIVLGAHMIVARADVALQRVLQGLSSPLYVTNAHDGTQRLFVVQQSGQILVLPPGTSTPTLFLDISSKVTFGGEQGLLGLAFIRSSRRNSRFFVDGFAVQDNDQAPLEPTPTMTFDPNGLTGLVDFPMQYLSGVTGSTCPGGTSATTPWCGRA
jgi:hypothetical protein